MAQGTGEKEDHLLRDAPEATRGEDPIEGSGFPSFLAARSLRRCVWEMFHSECASRRGLDG